MVPVHTNGALGLTVYMHPLSPGAMRSTIGPITFASDEATKEFSAIGRQDESKPSERPERPFCGDVCVLRCSSVCCRSTSAVSRRGIGIGQHVTRNKNVSNEYV